MIDVTEVEAVSAGDRVIIFGDNVQLGPTATEMSEILDTISYEVLTGIGARISRVYVNAEGD